SKQEDGKICPVVGKHTTRSSSEIIESKDYGKVEKPFVCESSASSKKAIHQSVFEGDEVNTTLAAEGEMSIGNDQHSFHDEMHRLSCVVTD
ncbi:hypothetical protein RRG08_056566, partial [Elysia crispata]